MISLSFADSSIADIKSLVLMLLFSVVASGMEIRFSIHLKRLAFVGPKVNFLTCSRTASSPVIELEVFKIYSSVAEVLLV